MTGMAAATAQSPPGIRCGAVYVRGEGSQSLGVGTARDGQERAIRTAKRIWVRICNSEGIRKSHRTRYSKCTVGTFQNMMPVDDSARQALRHHMHQRCTEQGRISQHLRFDLVRIPWRALC